MDDSHGWASGSGGIEATVDGGSTWSLQYGATPQDKASVVLTGIGALDFLDRDQGWAVDGGSLIETSDGGAIWTSVGKPDALHGASQLRFFDRRHGWSIVTQEPCSISSGCTDEGSLLSTSDGGLTWTQSSLHDSVLAMCWENPMVGWAGGSPLLYATTDGGITWRSISLPGFYPRPADPNQGAGTIISDIACFGQTAWVFGAQGVAAGSEGFTVDRTLDGGAHWQPVLGGAGGSGLTRIDDYAGPIAAPTAEAAYFVGFCPMCTPVETSISSTKDGGSTFQHFQVNPNVPDSGLAPSAVSFSDPEHGWILGAQDSPGRPATGEIYATTDGGKTWHLEYQSPLLSAPSP